jgi:hypothetical protein
MLGNINFSDYKESALVVAAGTTAFVAVGCAAKGCNALFHDTVKDFAKDILKNKLEISKEWRTPILNSISYILPIGLFAVTAAVAAAFNTVSFPAALAFAGIVTAPLAVKGILTLIDEYQKASEAAATKKKEEEAQAEVLRKETEQKQAEQAAFVKKEAALDNLDRILADNQRYVKAFETLDKVYLNAKAVHDGIDNEEANKENKAFAKKAMDDAFADSAYVGARNNANATHKEYLQVKATIEKEYNKPVNEVRKDIAEHKLQQLCTKAEMDQGEWQIANEAHYANIKKYDAIDGDKDAAGKAAAKKVVDDAQPGLDALKIKFDDSVEARDLARDAFNKRFPTKI